MENVKEVKTTVIRPYVSWEIVVEGDTVVIYDYADIMQPAQEIRLCAESAMMMRDALNKAIKVVRQ